MRMKAIGIALLAVCMVAAALANTGVTRSVSAHALLALSPTTEPPTLTSTKPPAPTDTPMPEQTSPPATQPPSGTEVPPSTPQPTNTPSKPNPRHEADLTITKQASTDVAVVGQVIDYTITITNKGDGPAGNVVMTDDLPGFLELVNVTVSRGVVAVNGKTVEVTFGEVAAGEVITVVISARVVAVATPPDNENIAKLTTSSTTDKKDNNSASTTVQIVPATPVPATPVPATPVPATPAPAPVPTAPAPVKLPPTGAGEGASPVWLLGIGLLAIVLGLGLRRARRSL